MTNKTARGSNTSVNGLTMYYELHGSGKPLILLYGNLSPVETSFGKLLRSLVETRQVIAIEQQAHGRTAALPSKHDKTRAHLITQSN